MDIEQLRKVCLSMPGTSEDIKWEADLCFLLLGKIFLVVDLDESPTSASFKVPPEQFDNIVQEEGFGQAPYFAKRQWIKTDDINRWSLEEWEFHARQSYRLIKSKLTKKAQRELDNENEKSA